MKPLKTRLIEARARLGIPWEVLERDYLLSWILAGMAQVDPLKDTLVFKGGTALKKCYFGDYRFSEDLDFSVTGNVPKGQDMESAMKKVCAKAIELLNPYSAAEIICERYIERSPHPEGQEAFNIRCKFPWHKQVQAKVMVEVSMNEKLTKPLVQRQVLHEYGEPLKIHVLTYALEEIISEKLCAILQHLRLYEQRGWVRSRARDYYDLWRILGDYKKSLNFSDFRNILHEKCSIKGVSFTTSGDFFPEPLLKVVEKTWNQWLGPLVTDLPPYNKVVEELRQHMKNIL